MHRVTRPDPGSSPPPACCEGCGAPLPPRTYQGGSGKRTCSATCRQRAWRRAARTPQSVTSHLVKGVWGTAAYRSWRAMLRRCRDSSRWSFPRYGGRGITVCERWQTFEHFLADLGPRPAGTTLDRIDNDGHYEPGNVRWATQAEQNANRDPARIRAAVQIARAAKAMRKAAVSATTGRRA